MNVFYIKLKTGEDLLAIHNPIETDTSDTVFLEGPIQFEADEETGNSLASYWITYSDMKNTNMNLNDAYFFGKATDHATKFYTTFVEQMAERRALNDLPKIDGMTDDDLQDIFENSSTTRH